MLSVRRFVPPIVVALAGLFPTAPARAQSEAEIALARKYFAEGEAAEKKRDCKTAVELFEKALAIKETPQIWLRVGACREKLQDPVAAAVAYERALERARIAKLDQVAAIAQEQLDGVRAQLGAVVLETKEPIADLVVKIDGQEISAAAIGGELPVRPGDHEVEATAPGRKPFSTSFRVAAKESKVVVLELAPDASKGPAAASAAGPGPDRVEPSDGGSNAPAIALLAGGGTAAIAGGVFLALSFMKDGDIDDLCGGPERLSCPKSREDEIASDVSTVNTFRAVGIAVGGVGLVAAGVGVAMLAVGSGGGNETSGTRVFPVVTARTAGVWVARAF